MLFTSLIIHKLSMIVLPLLFYRSVGVGLVFLGFIDVEENGDVMKFV